MCGIEGAEGVEAGSGLFCLDETSGWSLLVLAFVRAFNLVAWLLFLLFLFGNILVVLGFGGFKVRFCEFPGMVKSVRLWMCAHFFFF